MQKAVGVKAELGPGAENPLICWWAASRLFIGLGGWVGMIWDLFVIILLTNIQFESKMKK